jgi:hypothetical protein
LHLLALLLYAASINGYELAAPAIAMVGIVYLAVGPRRAALWSWAAAAALAAVMLLRYEFLVGGMSPAYSTLWQHLELIVGHGLNVVAYSLFPVANVAPWLVLVCASTLTAVCVGVSLLYRGDHSWTSALRRRVLMLAYGCLFVVAGWALIIPANLGYDPTQTGVGDRINAVAGIGVVVVVVAFYALVASTLSYAFRARGALLPLTIAIVMSAVGAGYYVQFHQDLTDWNSAGRQSAAFLSSLKKTLPHPAPRISVIFTFGVSGFSAPSVLIFGGAGNNDLLWAARIMYGDADLATFPVYAGLSMECNTKYVEQLNTGAPSSGTYGHVAFVNIANQSALYPLSEGQCLSALKALQPLAPGNEH